MADNSIIIDTSNFQEGLEGLASGVKSQLENAFLVPIAQEVLPCLNGLANSIVEAFSSDEISSRVQVIAEKLGEFAESIAGVVEEWLPGLQEGLTWVLGNSDAVAAGIIGIGTALKVFEAARLVMSLVNAFKLAKEAEAALTITTWLLNIALEACGGWIGLTIGIIAGIVAGVLLLWNTNEGFREAVIGAWNAICECATAVWGSICTFFTETIPEAFNSLVQFFTETVPEFFGTLWETICQLCSDGWNIVVAFFTETIPGFFTGLWQTVYQLFSDGWNLIVTFFTESIPAWIESIGLWFAELPNQIAYALGETLAAILIWGENTLNYLITNVPLWISGIVNFFTQLPTQIMTWLDTTLTNLVTWGSNMLLAATTAVSGIITAIVNFFMQLPTQIMTWLTTILTNLVTWGSSMLSTATTAVSGIITAIVNFFAQLPAQVMTWLSTTLTNLSTWGSNMLSTATTAMSNMVTGIINAVTNLPSQMITIGTNIVAGIRQGIEDAWKGLTDWVGGLADSFVQGFKDKLGIHSPSRIFRDEIGKNIIKGIGVGIELETPNLEDQMDANISNLTAKLQASVGYETARTTASIAATANNAAGVNNPTTTNNNDNGINVNIENFNGTDKQNIEELAQEIAFLSKRKLV